MLVFKDLLRMASQQHGLTLIHAVKSSMGAGRAVVLSNTVLSPSVKKAIAELGAEHVQYDANFL